MDVLKINADCSDLDKALSFIESKLKVFSLDDKVIRSGLLVAEETMVAFSALAEKDSLIEVGVKGNKKRASVIVKSRGNNCDISNICLNKELSSGDLEDDQQMIINSLILDANKDRFKFRYRKGVNVAEIRVFGDENEGFRKILLGIILGVITGIVLRLLNIETLNSFLSDNVFGVISSLFIGAMSMVVAPLVFFSIAESMTKFEDYATFGKVGMKVIAMYIVTTIVAISVGTLMFWVFKPGDPSVMNEVIKVIGSSQTAVAEVEVSLKSTLLNLVPTNMFGAFVNSDMLQIIFIAILMGISATTLGEYSAPVINFIKAGNELFLKLTSMIISVNPFVVFSIMANVLITMSMDSFAVLGVVGIASLCGVALMMSFYMLLVKYVGKISPRRFLHNFKDTILIAFSSCSSNAAVPFSMKSLKRLKVSSKIYSFSLPLGATINMDGLCIFLVISCLFFARIFSIEINFSTMLNLYLMITLISVGIPAVTGAVYAVLSLMLVQLGIPAGASLFIMPILTLLDFVLTTNNVVGDSVVTVCVARSEKMIDD